jgi:hypothetical protein
VEEEVLQQQVKMLNLIKEVMVEQVQLVHYQVHQQLTQVVEVEELIQHLYQQEQVEPEVVEQVL